MALVNYGSSDSESSDVETTAPSPTLAKKPAPKNSGGSFLGSLLPPPKNNAASIPTPKKTSRSTSSKPVIYVDLPKAHESDNDDEEEKKRSKRQKTATPGPSDLADLLPAPKRGYSLARSKPVAAAKTATAPPSVTKSEAIVSSDVIMHKPPAKPLAPTEKTEEALEEKETEEEKGDIQYSGPFFRLGAELKSKPEYSASATKKKPTTLVAESDAKPRQPKLKQQESPEQQQQQQPAEQQQQQQYMTAVDAYAYTNADPNAMYSYDPSQYYQYWQQYQQQEQEVETATHGSGSSADPFADMDEATYTRLTGKRKQREANVKFTTVNQEDILPDPEWHERNKQLQAPKFVSSAGSFAASGLQRKKNNIMALAAQAQSMQEQLNDQFASSRTTMQESRKKYGF